MAIPLDRLYNEVRRILTRLPIHRKIGVSVLIAESNLMFCLDMRNHLGREYKVSNGDKILRVETHHSADFCWINWDGLHYFKFISRHFTLEESVDDALPIDRRNNTKVPSCNVGIFAMLEVMFQMIQFMDGEEGISSNRLPGVGWII